MIRHRRGGSVDAIELAAVLEVCARDTSPRGRRDQAVLALLCAGLEWDEIRQLEVARNQICAGTAVKSSRIPESCLGTLEGWLEVRGPAPGPLFIHLPRGDRTAQRALGRSTVVAMLARRARQARVRPFSLRDLARGLPARPEQAVAGGQPAAADHDRSTVSRFLARLGPPQRARMKEALEGLARTLGGPADAIAFPWFDADPEELRRAFQGPGRLPTRLLGTAKKALSRLLAYARLQGAISDERIHALQRAWANDDRRGGLPLPISVEEIETMIGDCLASGSALAWRDACLIALIWREQSGVLDTIAFPYERAAEPSRTSRSLRPVPALVTEAVTRWCTVRGPRPGPLLCPVRRDGSLVPEALPQQTCAWVPRRRGQASLGRKVTAEIIRLSSIRYHWGTQELQHTY